MYVQVKYNVRYSCSKDKSENIGYKFVFFRNVRRFAMCFISLNEENSRLFFDVLFVRLPYSDPELSRFF